MKVAILQCDEVLDKLQSQFVSYNHMIQQMFVHLEGSFDFECFNCQQEEYPEDIDRFELFITTGSRASVYEDTPWIHRLISFVRLLDKEKKKLVGICFGHQVIALACQGKVEKSDRGWGVGLAKNRIVATPHWLGVQDQKDDLHILVSHQDQVTTIPETALVIAESDFCPYFMVQWNDYFLSIQGHPEWNRDFSRILMQERRGIIPHDRIENGLHSLKIDPDNSLFIRWMYQFVQQS